MRWSSRRLRSWRPSAPRLVVAPDRPPPGVSELRRHAGADAAGGTCAGGIRWAPRAAAHVQRQARSRGRCPRPRTSRGGLAVVAAHSPRRTDRAVWRTSSGQRIGVTTTSSSWADIRCSPRGSRCCCSGPGWASICRSVNSSRRPPSRDSRRHWIRKGRPRSRTALRHFADATRQTTTDVAVLPECRGTTAAGRPARRGRVELMTNDARQIEDFSPEHRRALLAELLRNRAAGPRTCPASFAQERLWFLEQLAPETPFFNIDTAVEIHAPVASAILERSLNEIVRRHEVLRTTFGSARPRPGHRAVACPVRPGGGPLRPARTGSAGAGHPARVRGGAEAVDLWRADRCFEPRCCALETPSMCCS